MQDRELEDQAISSLQDLCLHLCAMVEYCIAQHSDLIETLEDEFGRSLHILVHEFSQIIKKE